MEGNSWTTHQYPFESKLIVQNSASDISNHYLYLTEQYKKEEVINNGKALFLLLRDECGKNNDAAPIKL